MLLFVVVNITYDLECIKVKPLFHITSLLLSHSYHRVSLEMKASDVTHRYLEYN